MEIKALGPLSARQYGVSVVPTAAKPRQILALLALQADRVVTVPTLMEEIWGEDIPRSAATTLQTYILQLRRRIAAALDGDPTRRAKDVLVTQHGGYLLQVQPGHVDAQEFARLTATGRAAFEAGDHAAASDLHRQALEMWRGPALVDVRVGTVLELEVLRLEEDRMAALERRIDSDLALGRHSELVAELRVLVAKHPMHENFCAQLMTALHRAGGAWRALEAYQRLRTTLIDELGMEPSPRLRRLHQAVLSADPSLDLEVPAGG
ncbi:AfsR/SARP family transcriptional regulator [Streptomyces durbertensis]|uniref:AfsR/SARP family transcriptional regulator n=1 Tax=Streptomyces durbertensis TaxID=2448886 RepID=A0ABR6EA40_9ACTN|nr:AfsR/SARP family transcriptional regulator [Streptomyces durbertensis]MBB1242212.1 AfsR/SARP family transcriptional regulator [Streptomyces durbertensis]